MCRAGVSYSIVFDYTMQQSCTQCSDCQAFSWSWPLRASKITIPECEWHVMQAMQLDT